jgi:DNA-binding transcriptional LysR family regulator
MNTVYTGQMDVNQTQLATIALFCKAAELGSFTAAAHALGLTPAAVSRGVGRLEARLGVKLFRRSTRRMQLSEDGQLYFTQCHNALTLIEDTERTLTGNQSAPRGLLRVSVPSAYAHHRLLPRLGDFRKRHPEIALEIHLSSRNIDFVDEGFDVAIRLGEPPDSRLIARKIEDARVGVYASEAYLRARGTPKSLEDLQDTNTHTLLPFILPSTGRALPWIFTCDGEQIEFMPRSDLNVSEDPLGCVNLARAGLGIVQTYDWNADATLREVLKKFAGRTRPFYLLYSQNRVGSAKVRAFIDHLIPATK